MSSSSSEEEFELNYVKVDSKNEIRLLGKEDYEIEMVAFMCAVNEYKDENIGKKLSQFVKKIPESNDFLKVNSDYSKQFSKLLNADKKKGLNNSINTILSIDFKDKFIFNKSNIFNVCMILAYCFLDLKEMKRYKILTTKELKNAISKTNFEKLDLFNIFANNEYLKNKEKEREKEKVKEKEREKIDTSSSRASTQCRSTTFSSYGAQVKDLYEDISELEENILGCDSINRYHNEIKGLDYIDNNPKNIMCSSMLTSDYNYNGEEKKHKLLSKECFLYPKYNKNVISETNLPIELLVLLGKLKDVKTLVFQLQRIDEQFLKMAVFILINVKWLFMKGIKEIKFDLGNEEMQNSLYELFKDRTTELYYHFQKNINSIYYTGSYKARTINCWDPEGDIFFEKYAKEESNKKNDYLYHIQPFEETSTFDNHLCNIYNEFGNLTNLKYIRPIIFSNGSKHNNESPNDISIDNNLNNNYEALTLNESFGEISKSERDSLTSTNSFNISKLNQNLSQTFNNSQLNNQSNSIGKSTPQMIAKFVNKYKLYLEMIPIYSYFLSKNINNINSLSLYFHTPYLYEICQFFNMKLNFDNCHFLIFAKEIDSLKEANFSFNSLDDKSFQYIIGIIDNNIKITSLKLSFFTPDINYYDSCLFNLISSKKISLTKLFQDQKEFEIKFSQNREKSMNNFILNEKLLGPFATNLCSFLTLLKMKTLNYLEEFILRFDIPLPLLDNEKYHILIIKFIINILIMLTFQENKIHTLKILAPYLELNCSNMPYIRQLFKEILINDIIDDKFKDENDKKEKKEKKDRSKNRQRTIREQKEKEKEIELKQRRKELKEKFERKEFLEAIDSKDKINVVKEKKVKDDDDIDIDKQLEKAVYKRNNSMTHKMKKEASATIAVEEISSKKRSELNKNSSLKNIILQFKIYDLPEIFNICLMNNITGLKYINLGILDEVTFIGFMNDYKNYYNKLLNLTTLKISLGISVTNYTNYEKYIFEFININPPKIEEKFLFSELKIINETKMRELIELVYLKATVPKLVIQISNENEHILSKALYKFTNERKTEINTLTLILMDIPEYKQLFNKNILESLSCFYSLKKNRAILCKENPNNNN